MRIGKGRGREIKEREKQCRTERNHKREKNNERERETERYIHNILYIYIERERGKKF